MMTRMLVVLAVGLVLEAAGVVLLSKGQRELTAVFKPEFRALVQLALEAGTNRHILTGVALEAGFFGCLLFLLSRGDVSFVWPLTSLSLVVTTLTARWFLREEVSGLRWGGVLLIVMGAAVVTYTEHQKKRGKPVGDAAVPAHGPAHEAASGNPQDTGLRSQP